MRVRFWGVRGSLPTPATDDEMSSRLIEALSRLGEDPDAPDLSNRAEITRWVKALPPQIGRLTGGNTPCVEMTTRTGERFILDFGSGLRNLGNELMEREFGCGKGHAHLFLSHLHWDHIQGWPFFRPAYIEGNEFDLYARHENVENHLKKQQTEPFFPPAAWDDMGAEVRFHEMDEGECLLCDGAVRVSTLELEHPSRAFAFRFEADGASFVYASDGAFPSPDSEEGRPYIEFFEGTDLLIFDAQFTLPESHAKHTWGHSSSVTGVDFACRAKARQLALFHHDPNATEEHLEALLRDGKEYAQNPNLPCSPGDVEVFLAREGLEIELS